MNEKIDELDNLRTKQKKVNKNGWQASIYRAVMNKEPRFRGYCPFFWAVWGCLLIAIPVFILRGISHFGEWIFKTYAEKFENYKEDKKKGEAIIAEEKVYKLGDFSESDILFFANYRDAISRQRFEYLYHRGYEDYRAVAKFIENNEEAIEKLAVLFRAKAAKRQQQQAEHQKRAAARAAKMAKFVKPFFVLMGLIGTYFLFKAVLIVASLITWGTVLTFLITVIQLILVILAMATFVGVVYTLVRLLKFTARKGLGEGSFFQKVILEGMAELCKFVKETIKMLYIKECPLIEWGDESGPITKRKKD